MAFLLHYKLYKIIGRIYNMFGSSVVNEMTFSKAKLLTVNNITVHGRLFFFAELPHLESLLTIFDSVSTTMIRMCLQQQLKG